jgi:hypothetical protein
VLARVTELDLSEKQLRVLPCEIGLLPNLLELHCQNNPLLFLDEDIFDRLSVLQELNLSNTQLTALPAKVFQKLSQLKWLDLSGSAIEMLPPEVFSKLSKLEWLSLSRCPIQTFPDKVFHGLHQLEFLHLMNTGDNLRIPATLFEKLATLSHLSWSHLPIFDPKNFATASMQKIFAALRPPIDTQFLFT